MSLSLFPKACLVGFLLLDGCKSTPTSEVISNSVVNGLQSHVEAIELLDKQTTPECKTDAFIANLNALKAQTENMVGQVKSISQSCTLEKDVLKKTIENRNIIICGLGLILGFILFFSIKKRLF